MKINLDKAKTLDFLKRYALIIVGCIIYSLGVALFLDPKNLASGGVTGIAILLHYATGFNTGIIIIIINVPLFILGAIFFGRNFTLSTIFSTIVSSLFIELWNLVLKKYIPVTDDLLLSSLIGGALFGAGLGLVFRMNSTTGGTDILVKILRKKFRHIQTGIISMVIDAIIVASSALVIKDFDLMCYTFISIVAVTICFDFVLYGGNTAKMVYIITEEENAAAICERVMKDIDAGATYLDGEGAYTGDKKRVILCAVKNFNYPKLKDIVRELDPKAFMIVASAKEIYGEGYKDPTDDEL